MTVATDTSFGRSYFSALFLLPRLCEKIGFNPANSVVLNQSGNLRSSVVPVLRQETPGQMLSIQFE